MKYGNKPVANSPFRVRCGPPYDASKVKVSGPAVQKTGVVAEEVTKAVVDTTEAGIADLSGRLKGRVEERLKQMWSWIICLPLMGGPVLTLNMLFELLPNGARDARHM